MDFQDTRLTFSHLPFIINHLSIQNCRSTNIFQVFSRILNKATKNWLDHRLVLYFTYWRASKCAFFFFLKVNSSISKFSNINNHLQAANYQNPKEKWTKKSQFSQKLFNLYWKLDYQKKNLKNAQNLKNTEKLKNFIEKCNFEFNTIKRIIFNFNLPFFQLFSGECEL